MTRNQYYKTLPQQSFQQLKPNDYFRSIKQEAAVKEHNRKQSLENAKTETIEWCIRKFPWMLIALCVGWVLCSIFNALEVKQGVETALAVIFNMFLGSLIGKYVI